MAGPVFEGSVHITDRLVAPVAFTSGSAGTPGGSSTSVTLTVTALVAERPMPSSAFTMTS